MRLFHLFILCFLCFCLSCSLSGLCSRVLVCFCCLFFLIFFLFFFSVRSCALFSTPPARPSLLSVSYLSLVGPSVLFCCHVSAYWFSLWVLCLCRHVCLSLGPFCFLPLVQGFGLGHLSLSIFPSCSLLFFSLLFFSFLFSLFLSLHFSFLFSLLSFLFSLSFALSSLFFPFSVLSSDLVFFLHLSGSAGGGALIYLNDRSVRLPCRSISSRIWPVSSWVLNLDVACSGVGQCTGTSAPFLFIFDDAAVAGRLVWVARYLSLLLFQNRLKPKIVHRTQGGGSEFGVLC